MSKSGFDVTPFTAEQIEEAKKQLDAQEKHIVSWRGAWRHAGIRQRTLCVFTSIPLQLLQSGTERAFSGKYYKNKDDGVYISALTGVPMFDSSTKFVRAIAFSPSSRPGPSQQNLHFCLYRIPVLVGLLSLHLMTLSTSPR